MMTTTTEEERLGVETVFSWNMMDSHSLIKVMFRELRCRKALRDVRDSGVFRYRRWRLELKEKWEDEKGRFSKPS
jgi:hypothetical protein